MTTAIIMLACNSDKEQSPDVKIAAASFDMTKARAFIDSINTKFTEEFRKGDSLALFSHYWPEAELLLDNSEPIKGKDILSTFGYLINTGYKDFTLSTTDLTGDENFLIETGTYHLTDQKNNTEKGKYVVVWKNKNGEWNLYRDIGCTSMPPAGTK